MLVVGIPTKMRIVLEVILLMIAVSQTALVEIARVAEALSINLPSCGRARAFNATRGKIVQSSWDGYIDGGETDDSEG